MTNEIFKKALDEVSKWEFNLTESERSEIIYDEVRKKIVNRIFKKYKDDNE